jgi:hypothetical protein
VSKSIVLFLYSRQYRILDQQVVRHKNHYRPTIALPEQNQLNDAQHQKKRLCRPGVALPRSPKRWYAELIDQQLTNIHFGTPVDFVELLKIPDYQQEPGF